MELFLYDEFEDLVHFFEDIDLLGHLTQVLATQIVGLQEAQSNRLWYRRIKIYSRLLSYLPILWLYFDDR